MMFILIIVLILPVVILLLHHFALCRSDHQLPPGPYTWQVMRNISMYWNKPHIALTDLSKIYGPLISFRVGGQLVVVASSPSAARGILKTRTLSGRYMPSVYFNVPGTAKASVVMAKECNDSWKSLRALGQGYVFSSKAVESNSMKRKLKVREMVNFIRNDKIGQILKMEYLIFPTFANIVANTLVSRDLVGVDLEGKNDKKIMDFIESSAKNSTILGISDLYPILKRIDFWSKRKSIKILQGVKLIWGDILKERRSSLVNSLSSTQDFFDVLAEKEFSDEEMSLLLMEILIAAADTTTITTVWLLLELIKSPEILSKVRDEIANEAMDGNELSQPLLLSKCQYFTACVKETLRLHTPGPFAIPHRAIETCMVNDYIIPKDSIVLVNVWAIHLDTNNWEDAATFKPERFLNSKTEYRGFDFEYIPFGAGQRMCPGFNVAVTSVKFMVATLVHYFNWTLPNGMQPDDVDTSTKFVTALKLQKPLYLIPSVRNDITWD